MKRVLSNFLAFGVILLAGWAVLESAFFEHQLVAMALVVAAALVWFWAACLEDIASQEEYEEAEREAKARRARDLKRYYMGDDDERAC